MLEKIQNVKTEINNLKQYMESSNLDQKIQVIRKSYELNIRIEGIEYLFQDTLVQMLWILKAIKLIHQFDMSYKSKLFINTEF